MIIFLCVFLAVSKWTAWCIPCRLGSICDESFQTADSNLLLQSLCGVFHCVLLSFDWWNKSQRGMFLSLDCVCACICGTYTYISLFPECCFHLHRKCLTQRRSYWAAADRRSLAASCWIATNQRWYFCIFSVNAPPQIARQGFTNELNIFITFSKLIEIDEVGAAVCLTTLRLQICLPLTIGVLQQQ